MANLTRTDRYKSPRRPMAAGRATLLAPLRAELSRWPPKGSVTLHDTDAAYAALPPYARARFVYSAGALYKAQARCVYRRDESTAWALLSLIERYPSLPDFDVVLNCRDGPLMRRGRGNTEKSNSPLVLAYSSTLGHSEIAFPDYTLWGLPGKLKPWAQLRLDLLHRARRPYARKLPRLLATGVVNDYHNSLGVRTRQAVQQCARGPRADRRLDIRYHRLYFERWYSTEEHCAFRYLLLAPGSHAVWLDHLKHKLLCGSLVMLLEPPRSTVPPNQVQFDVLTRLLKPGVHYLSIPLPDLSIPDSHKRGAAKRYAASQRAVCEAMTSALDWAEANPLAAESIASAGRALVRDVLTMRNVYAFMHEVVLRSASLITYPTAVAMSTHRMIPSPKGDWWFNATNFTKLPRDPEAFERTLRNDSATYPVTAQISADEWAAVVLRYNFSRMGVEFGRSARELQHEVQLLTQQKDKEEQAAKKDAARRIREEMRLSGKRRGGGRGRGRGRRGRAK